MDTQTRLTLSDDELENIRLDIEQGSWVDAVTSVFRLFGVNLSDPELERINPADYAIPATQWQAICQWCVDSDCPPSDVTRVNHGLDWMNYGPSSFAEGA